MADDAWTYAHDCREEQAMPSLKRHEGRATSRIESLRADAPWKKVGAPNESRARPSSLLADAPWKKAGAPNESWERPAAQEHPWKSAVASGDAACSNAGDSKIRPPRDLWKKAAARTELDKKRWREENALECDAEQPQPKRVGSANPLTEQIVESIEQFLEGESCAVPIPRLQEEYSYELEAADITDIESLLRSYPNSISVFTDNGQLSVLLAGTYQGAVLDLGLSDANAEDIGKRLVKLKGQTKELVTKLLRCEQHSVNQLEALHNLWRRLRRNGQRFIGDKNTWHDLGKKLPTLLQAKTLASAAHVQWKAFLENKPNLSYLGNTN